MGLELVVKSEKKGERLQTEDKGFCEKSEMVNEWWEFWRAVLKWAQYWTEFVKNTCGGQDFLKKKE